MFEGFIKLKSSKYFQPLWDVFLFSVLLFGFHFLYLAWSDAGFYPIGEVMHILFTWAGGVLFNNCKAILDLLGVDFLVKGMTFYFNSSEGEPVWLEIIPACSGVKPWLQWVFLILIFPGSWKHKLWFIPAGMIVIHILSVIRIMMLFGTLYIDPDKFVFFHEQIGRFLFYGVIFLMWVIWVEYFKGKKSSRNVV